MEAQILARVKGKTTIETAAKTAESYARLLAYLVKAGIINDIQDLDYILDGATKNSVEP